MSLAARFALAASLALVIGGGTALWAAHGSDVYLSAMTGLLLACI